MPKHDLGAKKSAGKKGVYAEVHPELFDRLEKRRKKNKDLGRKVNSNYSILEAGLEMALDYFDELDAKESLAKEAS